MNYQERETISLMYEIYQKEAAHIRVSDKKHF